MDPSQGGPPQVCAHLASLQARSSEVAIASYTSPRKDTSVIADNVQSDWIGDLSTNEKLFASAAKEYFDRRLPSADILHIHNVWESVLVTGSRSATSCQTPYVITPHGMLDPWSMRQKGWKKKLALILGRRRMIEGAKFIHVLNSEEESGIRELGIRNRCEVIPNGVSLELIDPHLNPDDARDRIPELEKRPFIIFLSRLHYKKGLDILARACKPFFYANPDWRLVVAGPDDGAEEAFRKQIAELGIEKHVLLVGPIYGNLKYSLLAASDIFCLPSRQEGFSVAILEGLAASKPAVISTHCHFEEVGNVEAGLVTSLEPDEISERLCYLADSHQLRKQIGQRARQLVEEKYTWASVVSMLQAKYEAS